MGDDVGAMDELFAALMEPEPSAADLRDPGLHPGTQLFISNVLMEYLICAPGRINALFSAYDILNRGTIRAAKLSVPHARAFFLDSGCISALLACMHGRLEASAVRGWLDRTPEVVALAHELHDAGAPPGVVAAMDLPAYMEMLGPAGYTVAEAEEITLANAELMLHQVLPPGWRPVFTTQGLTTEDHQRCLTGYERMGALKAVREGRAWLAVGGMAFESEPERVWTVHRAVREWIGPKGHIHALGVSRVDVLVPMLLRGWVNSADSSSPVQEVRDNRGPYGVRSGVARPSFLVYALHAAASLWAEVELAKALERAAKHGLSEQVSLWEVAS